MNNVKYIIIFGNVVDGLTFRGPFETSSAAIDYADPLAEEWVIAELTPPQQESDQ